MTSQTYDTAKTAFVARRFTYGFNNTSGLNVSYGDDSSVSLTHYGAGDFTLGRGPYPATFNTNYNLSADGRMVVGGFSPTATTYAAPGYYGVNLYYNRQLTDQEIQDIYDYYKSAYNLV